MDNFRKLAVGGCFSLALWQGVGSAQGQTAAPSQSAADMQVNISSLVRGLPAELPNGSSEMKGSPYAIAQWLPGHLTLSNKLSLKPVPLKYDVLHQRLLMRPDFKSRDSLLLDDQLVARFTLDEAATALAPAQTRTFQRFSDAPEARARAAYVEVLHESRYALLKQYVKVLHKADYQAAYSNGSHYDEVEDKLLYYLRRPDGSVVPVKLNLKSLAAAAPDLAPRLPQTLPLPKTDRDWAAAFHAADPR